MKAQALEKSFLEHAGLDVEKSGTSSEGTLRKGHYVETFR